MNMGYRGVLGSIEVICGSMFSGKTEELIRRLRRAQFGRQKIQIFKPHIDTRYHPSLVISHSELKIEAIAVKDSRAILDLIDDNTRVVGIDEAQFFETHVVDVCQKLANRGLRVIVAGLDMDYCGRPFGSIPDLLAIAEYVTKVSAICVVCGAPASRSQRLDKQTQRVLLGAAENYEARCRMCHEIDQQIEEQLPNNSNEASPYSENHC